MSCPTLYDLVVKLDPTLADKTLTGDDFAAWRLPFFGGCALCGATIAAFNACMGRNGVLVGTCCATEENALSMPEMLAERLHRSLDRVQSSAERMVARELVVQRMLVARRDLNALSHDRAGVWTRPDGVGEAEFDDAWQRFADAIAELEGDA